MILQPPPAEFSVFDIGNWRWSSSLIWITAFAALIFGILLFINYFNNRKTHHLLWSISMFGIWIISHVINVEGSYEPLIEPSMSDVLDPIFIICTFIAPGLIAAGLWQVTFKDKEYGKWYLIFVLVMTPIILIAKLDPSFGNYEGMDMIESLAVMVFHIPSGLSLLILPIITTKDRNGLLISIGGVLMGLVGIILSVLGFLPPTNPEFAPLYAEGAFVDIIFAILPFILLGAILCFALGMLLTKDWTFDIPGIEFEERETPPA